MNNSGFEAEFGNVLILVKIYNPSSVQNLNTYQQS
ncbi:hypothetical protein AEQU1_02062 [Aequorivita sp. CIP111184]|nr:hypothetical protein AEQU1_02062 [Aequorivita sp. CIP111184]